MIAKAASKKKNVRATSGSSLSAVYFYVYKKRMLVMLGLLVVVVSLDQYTKIWVRDTLTKPLPRGAGLIASDDVQHYAPQRDIRVVDGIFHLQYAENPAAAFSLALRLDEAYRRPLLLGVSYVAMTFILIWLWRLKEPDPLMVFALAFILCGAVGNAVDRHLYGYVIDFISWRLTRWFPGLPPWPTFNIADSAIVGGAIGILIRAFVPFAKKSAA